MRNLTPSHTSMPVVALLLPLLYFGDVPVTVAITLRQQAEQSQKEGSATGSSEGQHRGADCFESCGRSAGFCDWCGQGKACCRSDSSDGAVECEGVTGFTISSYECVDPPAPALVVDSAQYSVRDDESSSMDVTRKVNELIQINGAGDITNQQTMLTIFGDPWPNRGKILRVTKGNRTLKFRERPVVQDKTFDLRQLFGHKFRVDSAVYRSADPTNYLFIDVTDNVNSLVEANGVNDITAQGDLNDMFGDPAHGQTKVLRVAWGPHMADLREPATGGPLDKVYNLANFFHSAEAANRRNQTAQPSIFIGVFSRRTASVQRSLVRDMWLRAASSSGSVTVKFAICDNSDDLSLNLLHEDAIHGDILLLNCTEGYGEGALTRKVLAMMRAFMSDAGGPERQLFMKVDDDTFVSWSGLPDFLETHAHSMAYMGVPIDKAVPCRNESYLWYEPYSTFNGTYFPKAMAGGSGYILGRELVHQIVSTGIAERNLLWNEDRAVGVWVGALQAQGAKVDFVSIPGVDGWWKWDWRRPTKNWATWGDYKALVHHGLRGETIACLAISDWVSDPNRRMDACFETEENRQHAPLKCAEQTEEQLAARHSE